MKDETDPNDGMLHDLFKALEAENREPSIRSGNVWSVQPRGEIRYSSPIRVAVQDVFHGSKEFKCPCINLSEKGFCINYDAPCRAGELLAFRMELPNRETVSGMAEVVWSHPTDDPARHMCGTKLLPLNPSEAMKLAGYVRQLQAAMLQ